VTPLVLAIMALAIIIGAIPVWVAVKKPARFRTVYRVYAWFLSMLIFSGAAYSFGYDAGARDQLQAIMTAFENEGMMFPFGSLRTFRIAGLSSENNHVGVAFAVAGTYLALLWLYEQKVARPERNRGTDQ